MRTLILPIGPHKTGTTYLQQQLCERRAELLESGVLYPEAFIHPFGHHLLFRAFNSLRVDEPIQRDLEGLAAFEG